MSIPVDGTIKGELLSNRAGVDVLGTVQSAQGTRQQFNQIRNPTSGERASAVLQGALSGYTTATAIVSQSATLQALTFTSAFGGVNLAGPIGIGIGIGLAIYQTNKAGQQAREDRARQARKEIVQEPGPPVALPNIYGYSQALPVSVFAATFNGFLQSQASDWTDAQGNIFAGFDSGSPQNPKVIPRDTKFDGPMGFAQFSVAANPMSRMIDFLMGDYSIRDNNQFHNHALAKLYNPGDAGAFHNYIQWNSTTPTDARRNANTIFSRKAHLDFAVLQSSREGNDFIFDDFTKPQAVFWFGAPIRAIGSTGFTGVAAPRRNTFAVLADWLTSPCVAQEGRRNPTLIGHPSGSATSLRTETTVPVPIWIPAKVPLWILPICKGSASKS